jgi:hypothetical protein
MKHKHKSGASFELPDDITQGQLEIYEAEARRILKDEEVTDALLARAAISGAFNGEIITASEGLPKAEKDLKDAPARLLWWMARKLAEYIADLKAIDPN